MKPRIVRKKAFLEVGMRYVGKPGVGGEIPKMWGRFMQRFHEIKHRKRTRDSYGLCYELGRGKIEYIAGAPVTALKDIPKGMVGKKVPAQTYAVFTSKGLKNIGPTYRYISSEWLPKSGYKYGKGPDFEYYDKSFDPDDPKSKLYIYFPIVKK